MGSEGCGIFFFCFASLPNDVRMGRLHEAPYSVKLLYSTVQYGVHAHCTLHIAQPPHAAAQPRRDNFGWILIGPRKCLTDRTRKAPGMRIRAGRSTGVRTGTYGGQCTAFLPSKAVEGFTPDLVHWCAKYWCC